jgi:hypothetical protein
MSDPETPSVLGAGWEASSRTKTVVALRVETRPVDSTRAYRLSHTRETRPVDAKPTPISRRDHTSASSLVEPLVPDSVTFDSATGLSPVSAYAPSPAICA